MGKSLDYLSETFVYNSDLKYFYHELEWKQWRYENHISEQQKVEKSTNVSDLNIKKLSVVKPVSG